MSPEDFPVASNSIRLFSSGIQPFEILVESSRINCCQSKLTSPAINVQQSILIGRQAGNCQLQRRVEITNLQRRETHRLVFRCFPTRWQLPLRFAVFKFDCPAKMVSTRPRFCDLLDGPQNFEKPSRAFEFVNADDHSVAGQIGRCGAFIRIGFRLGTAEPPNPTGTWEFGGEQFDRPVYNRRTSAAKGRLPQCWVRRKLHKKNDSP